MPLSGVRVRANAAVAAAGAGGRSGGARVPRSAPSASVAAAACLLVLAARGAAAQTSCPLDAAAIEHFLPDAAGLAPCQGGAAAPLVCPTACLCVLGKALASAGLQLANTSKAALVRG